jgi:hypothetical protein
MRVGPPRDGERKIVAHDHSEILDEHHLIRLTHTQDLCPDGGGKTRIASGAFSESADGGCPSTLRSG